MDLWISVSKAALSHTDKREAAMYARRHTSSSCYRPDEKTSGANGFRVGCWMGCTSTPVRLSFCAALGHPSNINKMVAAQGRVTSDLAQSWTLARGFQEHWPSMYLHPANKLEFQTDRRSRWRLAITVLSIDEALLAATRQDEFDTPRLSCENRRNLGQAAKRRAHRALDCERLPPAPRMLHPSIQCL